MQGDECMCLMLGRQKGKKSNSPPRMGEERRKNKRWGEGEKKISYNLKN